MTDASPALPSADAEKTALDIALRFATRNARVLAPLLTLVVLIIFFWITTDTFMRVSNLRNVVTQVAPIAVAATGVTFVLLCAEIDLSIASVAVFAGMMCAWFWVGDTIALGNAGILVAILIAALLGLINGFFVSYVGIPSFMMTLAMLTIAGGLAIFVNDGKQIFDVPEVLEQIAKVGNRVLGIPVVGLIAAAVLLAGHVILAYTRFGRQVYMTGGNREAAEMSGVDTKRVIMLVMMISGLTAGMAGMLFIGRLHAANPAGGQNMLIDTIAAVVLGGTSLFGGEGGMLNTVLGVLIFAVLSNGLNLLPNVSIYFKEALTGIILLCALLLNVLALRLETYQRRTE